MSNNNKVDFNIKICKRPDVKNVSLHTHNVVELVYIHDGEGELWINNEKIGVNKGDLLFYNIGELHSLNKKSELNATNIQIHPSLLDESLVGSESAIDLLTLSWFNEFSSTHCEFKPVVSFKGKERMEIDFIVSSMLEEYSQKENGYKGIVSGYLTVLFAKLFRQWESRSKLSIRQDMGGILSEVIEYIDQNYQRKITLEELAKQSFYQPNYFSTIFKECFGISPIKYINQRRIKKAMYLLKNTEESIETIIHSVGYADRKHFYKIFKEEIGITPGEYRKSS